MTSVYSPERRTAVVFAGTGAHGAYHAGVLRALEEAGVKLDLCAGHGVGAANAAHSAPEGYADTVLTVRADSTAWATQLRHLAPQLVAMLNEQLGDGTITRIKVLGPDAPSWKKGPRSVRDGQGPRDTYG